MTTPPLPRRSFIRLLGGGAVLATVPGLTACVGGMPDTATEPWRTADESDLRRHMLANAMLAPNPHNRQPWLADLRRAGEITLVCDGERLLPETDPFGRQILIGCGAFIELAVIAAAERGVAVEVLTFPDGAPTADRLPVGSTVARLVLKGSASATRDPLFAQIRRRHTNKLAYDNTRSVAPERWAELSATASSFGLLAGEITDATRIAAVRGLTRASYEIESTTPRTWLESARLLRIGAGEIAEHRDGISVPGTMPTLLSKAGLFDRFEVPAPGSSGYRQVMDRWMAFETGSGYFWIASRGNTRSHQLAAGRAWVRAHLQATAAGIDMHPLSQALQEFAEVAAPRRELHALLGFDGGATTLQMLARVGYGAATAMPSPRRPLAQLIRA